MPAVDWRFARNGEQFGPVSAAALKRMAARGELSPDDLVWRAGMEQWKPRTSTKAVEVTAMAAIPTGRSTG